MSKGKKARRIQYRFIAFPWDIANSPSFKAMRPSACKLYVMIELHYGEVEVFSLSARDAAKLSSCDKDTAASALQELVSFGYLRIEKAATFNTAKGNFATDYSLGRRHGWDFLQNLRVGKIPRTGPKSSDPLKMNSGKHGSTGPKSSDPSSCFENSRVPKIPTHSRYMPPGGSNSPADFLDSILTVATWNVFSEGLSVVTA
jgi:hypothetical protein